MEVEEGGRGQGQTEAVQGLALDGGPAAKVEVEAPEGWEGGEAWLQLRERDTLAT